ncbi:glycosyltransferase [Brevibacillus panacihumi]|uniref:glycosyltransferase n=1 Tax=Brevibacillus panacihumi TaxID=497735 RepID=UPI003D08E440
MNISACVITKNEEKNLPACLNSLRSIVSEMIVVDTGSTDRTVEVAKSLGAQVYHFDWINDFSKAKNYAISKATGDWIIFLDADEYFTSESLPLIPLVIQEAEEKNCDIIVSLLCNIDTLTKETINTVHHARIFRNHPEIRYEGAIHERIMKSGKAPKGLMASEGLAIIHTGYSSDEDKSKEKSDRNIKLLYTQLENNPQSGEVYFYLAESYMAARDFEPALNYAIKSVELDNCSLLGVKQKNYLNIITCMLYLEKEKTEVESWIRKGIERFPDYPDFYLLLANLYSQANRYHDALEAYTKGYNYIENALKSQSSAPHQAHKILTTMGELNLKIGQIHESVKHFISAINIDKYHYIALLYLLKLFTRYEADENTKQFFLRIYDITSKKDLLYLTRACLEVNNHVLGGYFISLFNEKDFHMMQEEYAEFTLLSGEYAKAAELYEVNHANKQSEGMNIKTLCASYLSGDQILLCNYFHKYSGELFDDISKCLGSLNTDDFYQFIAYLIKLQKVEKVMELKRLIEQQNVELEVADLLFTNEYFTEAEAFYHNVSLHAKFEGTELAILLCKQGECLWRSGRNNEAKPLAYKARTLFAQDYRPHILLMSILNETEDIEELKQVLQEASEYFPDSSYIQSVQSVLNNL